jgi:hypothetical protein
MDCEITNLHKIFTNLFNELICNNFNNYEKEGETIISEIGLIDNPIIFNYEFSKEIDYGFIEYKRTLINYDIKKSKLLRQIYWRISEFSNYTGIHLVNKQKEFQEIYDKINKDICNYNINYNLCYYIIGLENSGIYSNININELLNSLNIIKKIICDTNIKCEHMFLFNKKYNSYILLLKLYIENINYLEWCIF